MPNNTELIHIPLNAGQREDIDPKLLPQGLLRRAKNLRLRKAGRLGLRRGYGQLGTTDIAGTTIRFFDVASHAGVILGFGTTNPLATGPEAVFVYDAARFRWRAETAHASRPRQFSCVSDVLQLFRPSFAKTDEALLYDIAVSSGRVALVYEGDDADKLVFVHIFSSSTGALLFETTVSNRVRPRVSTAGTTFVFAWQDLTGDVWGSTFTPASSTALSAEVLIHNAGSTTEGMDLVPVSGASECLLFVVDGGFGLFYRYDGSLAGLAFGTLSRADVTHGSVSSVSGGTTAIAFRRSGGTYELQSFDTATLTTATGPTALFGGATGARPPGIVRKNTTTLVVSVAIPDTYDHQLKVDTRNVTTHVATVQQTFREVSQQSKPFVSSDGQYVGVISPYGKGGLVSFSAVFDIEYGRTYEAVMHRGYAVDALPGWLGSVVTDGTRHYAVMVADDLSCSHIPVVVSFRLMSPERRQTAQQGNLLFTAGGAIGEWDGQRWVEAGFFDAPVIVSATPSNGAGALTSDSEYSYVAHYEWPDARGNRHQGPVSDPVLVTLGAADDTVTIVVTTEHNSRRTPGSDTAGKVVISRTKAFPDRTHRRCAQAYSSSAYAATVSVTDLASDDEISTQEVVYTQGARGSLSGPLQHDAPSPAEYLWATRERILGGGLPDRSSFQESKRLFPGEPVNWSQFPGFFGAVGQGRLVAVCSQDDLDFVFTNARTFVIGGAGPDDNGNGEFAAPRELPGDSVGVRDWRSVVVDSKGIWFKSFAQRLHMIPRGGGAAEWLGQPVRDTIEAYTSMTSASVCPTDNTVVWTCNNAAGTEGVMVAHDCRTGDWYVDTMTELGSAAIQAAITHTTGLMLLVVANNVWTQRSINDTQAGVTLDGLISYDDGVTFTSMGDAPFSVSGAVGSTFACQWYPARRKGDRYVLRFDVASTTVGSIPYSFTTGTIAPWGAEGWGKLVAVTLTSEVSSDGLLFSNLTLEVAAAKRSSRKSAAQRK